MTQALFVLYGEKPRDRAIELIRRAPEGTRVEFKDEQRTLDQNSKMWAMLTEVAEQVVWYGRKLKADDWKDMFTASLRKARVVPGIDAGSFVPLGMHTSNMSKGEMSDLIELMYAFGADPDHPVKFREPAQQPDGALA